MTDNHTKPEATIENIENPVPKPIPRPIPQVSQVGTPAVVLVDAGASAQAATWGRVDEEGNVFVKDTDGERIVGQYAAGNIDEALDLYVRRFLDLQASVALLEVRVTQIPTKESSQQLKSLTEQIKEPAAVGDIQSLRDRLSALEKVIAERKEAEAKEREAAKAKALELRQELVEKIESLANQDPTKTHWKHATEEVYAFLDEWKTQQRQGPRLDRSIEDGLWRRFSAARTNFERQRKQFFSEIDSLRAKAKKTKEKLIAEAERASSSTDWGNTSSLFHDLMDQWRKAGQASYKEDQELWARFRSAQQAFFDARNAANRQQDKEQSANLKAKLEILEEAEKLLPITDITVAKTKLRNLQSRWETVGRVPRNQVSSIEGRMRAVEQAVKDAEHAEWRRTDPETKARAEGMTAQLHEAIAKLESDLEVAKAAGDQKVIKKVEEDLKARKQWLELISKASRE